MYLVWARNACCVLGGVLCGEVPSSRCLGSSAADELNSPSGYQVCLMHSLLWGVGGRPCLASLTAVLEAGLSKRSRCLWFCVTSSRVGLAAKLALLLPKGVEQHVG